MIAGLIQHCSSSTVFNIDSASADHANVADANANPKAARKCVMGGKRRPKRSMS